MAISFVGGYNPGDSQLPAHSPDDVIIAFAFRDGSNTPPSVPYDWTILKSGGANSCSFAIAYRYGDGDVSFNESSWTNSTGVSCAVYRAEKGFAIIGSPSTATPSAMGEMATSSYLIYYAGSSQAASPLGIFSNGTRTPVTLGDSCWVVTGAGHRSANNLTESTPSGYTARSGKATECRIVDTNGRISWDSGTQNVSSPSGWITCPVMLLERDSYFPSVDGVFDNFTGPSVDPMWNAQDTTPSSMSVSNGLSVSISGPSGVATQLLFGSGLDCRNSDVIFGPMNISGSGNDTDPYAFVGLVSYQKESIIAGDSFMVTGKSTRIANDYRDSSPVNTFSSKWVKISLRSTTDIYESPDGFNWTLVATGSQTPAAAYCVPIIATVRLTSGNSLAFSMSKFNVPPTPSSWFQFF